MQQTWPETWSAFPRKSNHTSGVKEEKWQVTHFVSQKYKTVVDLRKSPTRKPRARIPCVLFQCSGTKLAWKLGFSSKLKLDVRQLQISCAKSRGLSSYCRAKLLEVTINSPPHLTSWNLFNQFDWTSTACRVFCHMRQLEAWMSFLQIIQTFWSSTQFCISNTNMWTINHHGRNAAFDDSMTDRHEASGGLP